jgi:hypothetical protein
LNNTATNPDEWDCAGCPDGGDCSGPISWYNIGPQPGFWKIAKTKKEMDSLNDPLGKKKNLCSMPVSPSLSRLPKQFVRHALGFSQRVTTVPSVFTGLFPHDKIKMCTLRQRI